MNPGNIFKKKFISMRPGPYFRPGEKRENMPFYRYELRFFRCFEYLCKVKHSPTWPTS